MPELTVAIMAGGKSSRMGTDKSFVPLLGKPMIEHLLAQVADLGQAETIISTNRRGDYAHLGLPMYADMVSGKGPLAGIYSAIHHSNSEYTLVVACDMPFVSPALLRYMIALCDGELDVIVPRVDKYPQGVHAIYSKRCLAPIGEHIEANRLKIIGFYDKVKVRYIDEPEYRPFDPQGLALQNVNTPEELEEARRRAKNVKAIRR